MNFSYDTRGTYTVKVEVEDDFGARSSDTATVEIINSPPVRPSTPLPMVGRQGVLVDSNISWYGGDPDDTDQVTYDVYFGKSNPPPYFSSVVVPATVSNPVFSPGGLDCNSSYYWQIVARDDLGETNGSEVWWFTTRPENQPPYSVSYFSPLNLSINVSLDTVLCWCGGDSGYTTTYYQKDTKEDDKVFPHTVPPMS